MQSAASDGDVREMTTYFQDTPRWAVEPRSSRITAVKGISVGLTTTHCAPAVPSPGRKQDERPRLADSRTRYANGPVRLRQRPAGKPHLVRLDLARVEPSRSWRIVKTRNGERLKRSRAGEATGRCVEMGCWLNSELTGGAGGRPRPSAADFYVSSLPGLGTLATHPT